MAPTDFTRGFASIPDHFQEHEEAVRGHLVSYFENRSGRFFETISQSGNPYELDGSEIAAATCLSLKFDHQTVANLFAKADDVNRLLEKIPVDVPIWEADDSIIGRDSAAWALYDLIDGLPGFGVAYTSKLLAAKRPHLIPIRDSDVSKLLGDPKEWWVEWRSLTADAAFRQELRGLRSSLDLEHVSLLRIVDVVLWESVQHS